MICSKKERENYEEHDGGKENYHSFSNRLLPAFARWLHKFIYNQQSSQHAEHEHGANRTGADKMSEQKLSSRHTILTYMFAGRATFTLKSLKTGEHLTFKLLKSRQHIDLFWLDNLNGDGIAKLKINPDRDPPFEHYQRRAGLRSNLKYAQAFEWFLNHLESKQVEFYHLGKCGRCGRALTDPNSIKLGIGPECANKMDLNLAEKSTLEMF